MQRLSNHLQSSKGDAVTQIFLRSLSNLQIFLVTLTSFARARSKVASG